MPKGIPFVDGMAGARFGRWIVLSLAGRKPKSPHLFWRCKCDCGEDRDVSGCQLRRGQSKSCGCLARDLSSQRNGVHRHSYIRTTTYTIWQGMLSRCGNKNSSRFKDYGGRGVSVCARWRDGEDGLTGFQCFLADMGERPNGLQIDRYPNNDGNYEPTNCRWATPKQNASNRRKSSRDL